MATWYRTGTVTVTNGSATVTGSGTAFVENVKVGEEFRLLGGGGYEILAVVSNTQLTLASAYLGGTQSGQSYEIVPVRGFLTEAYAALSSAQAAFSGYLSGVLSGLFSSGSVGAPGVAFSEDPDTGMRRSGANALSLVTGGADQLTLTGGVATGAAVQSSVTDSTAGKLLKVGAFGVGGEVVPPSASISINDASLPGGVAYRWQTGVTPGDIPGGSDGSWMHFQRGGGVRAHQIGITQSSDTTYIRFHNGTSWSDWQQILNQSDIVGTVSQSGGVPTGSVIETGSNANGRYTRWADGTLMCSVSKEYASIAIDSASVNYGYRNATALSWTFPALFSDDPVVTGLGFNGVAALASVTVSGSSFWMVSPNSVPAADRELHMTAVGRWF